MLGLLIEGAQIRQHLIEVLTENSGQTPKESGLRRRRFLLITLVSVLPEK